MKLIKRTRDQLAVPLTPGLHPWDRLISILMQRSSELTDCEVTVIRFGEIGKSLSFMDGSGILIGRVDPLLETSTRVFSMHVFGKVLDQVDLQRARALWEQSGYSELADKNGITFASGKLDLEGLTFELARSLSMLESFYGVRPDSAVDGIGDPRLEELLAGKPAVKLRRALISRS